MSQKASLELEWSFEDQSWTSTCIQVPCPPKTVEVPAFEEIRCACLTGYTGEFVAWDPVAAEWDNSVCVDLDECDATPNPCTTFFGWQLLQP